MITRLRVGGVAVLSACLCSTAALRAQEKRPNQAKRPEATATSRSSQKKAILTDATRVSTDKALENAAKQKVKDPADEGSSPSNDSAVTELRPARRDQDGKAEPPKIAGSAKTTKRGPLKGIHGTVYGRADSANPGNRTTGGTVGASSKGGNTSVYVETQRARATSPRP